MAPADGVQLGFESGVERGGACGCRVCSAAWRQQAGALNRSRAWSQQCPARQLLHCYTAGFELYSSVPCNMCPTSPSNLLCTTTQALTAAPPPGWLGPPGFAAPQGTLARMAPPLAAAQAARGCHCCSVVATVAPLGAAQALAAGLAPAAAVDAALLGAARTLARAQPPAVLPVRRSLPAVHRAGWARLA